MAETKWKLTKEERKQGIGMCTLCGYKFKPGEDGEDHYPSWEPGTCRGNSAPAPAPITIIANIAKTTGATCAVCGRPWLNGKCSGGFINHKAVSNG